MASVHRFAFALTLTCAGALITTAASGCDRSGRQGGRSPGLDLPDPLPLPADPPALAHVEAPAELLGLVDPWLDLDFTPRATLERELLRFTTPEMADAIAAAIDPTQPWDVVRLGPDEEIAWVPVREDARAGLTVTLDGLPREGDFGAHVLPRDAKTSSAPVHLAWLDPRSGHLAVAQSLRGLATAPQLAETYGEQPVVLAVDASLLPDALPVARAKARGTSKSMDIEVVARDGFDVGDQLESTEGALTGLLGDPTLVGAVSSRWVNHEGFVKQIIADIGDEVNAQPFLVRGIFEDMARRFNAVLRSWNGRWAAGVAQGGHVYAAFGTDDPKKSGVATLRFLQAVVDNVKLARNFTQDVPNVSLKKNAGDAGGEPIHRFRFARAAKFAPDLEPVLDDKGRLNVAFAFSRHAGAGLVVVGPEPVVQARKWLIASNKGASGSDSTQDLAAATLSITPAQLKNLRDNANPETVLSLQAAGPRRDLTVRQTGPQRFVIHFEELGGGAPMRTGISQKPTR